MREKTTGLTAGGALKLPLESAEQIAVVDWCLKRSLLVVHVANERHCSAREGARLKAMGVRPGFPDLVLFTRPPAAPGAPGAFLEMKRRDGGTRGALQDAWGDTLRSLGWVGGFAVGAAEAVTMLKAWGYDRE